MDLESRSDTDKKQKLPRSIFFIISNEFCERFSFYGIRTILPLFLREKIGYADNTVITIYHSFSMLVYFFPLLGAIIADSFLGRYKTIFYLSMVYALGQLLLSTSAIPMNFSTVEITLIGLLLVAAGTGGIKPCVSAFGGDQFVMPQQARYLAMFFSLFYFAINFGSLFSTFLTPILRKDVKCFGEQSCYSLAFFVPCALMIVSIVIFVAGKRKYKVLEPKGNVVADVVKCTSHAIARKIKSKKVHHEHWLDYAEDKFDKSMISDIKAAFGVLKLFLPLPIFWALFDQQGSRWTFQASNMDGRLGLYTMKPDQMQVVNPFLILLFIPIFEAVIYPLLNKINLATPLRKLTLGGILAGVAFMISTFVEISVEKTYPVLPESGLGQLRIYNTLNCSMSGRIENDAFNLKAFDMWEKIDYRVDKNLELNYEMEYTNCLYAASPNNKYSGKLNITEGVANSVVATAKALELPFKDSVSRPKTGEPMVRTVLSTEDNLCENANVPCVVEYVNLKTDSVAFKFNFNSSVYASDQVELESGSYQVRLNGTAIVSNTEFHLGGVYTIIGRLSKTAASGGVATITKPNSVHMLWQVPQYIVMTMAEVMFSVTGLEFAFTQAPETMKSLLQASWLLTVAFGNLIVVIFSEIDFGRQVFDYIFYSALMFVDIFIFAIMAKFYKYKQLDKEEDINEDLQLSDNIGAFSPSFADSDKHH